MSQSEPINRRKLLADGGSQAPEHDEIKGAKQQQQQGRKEQPGKGGLPAVAASGAKQDQAATAALSVGSTQQREHESRHVPQLSDQCYQLAALAEPPKLEQSYGVRSIAYSALTTSLDHVEKVTGLQTLSRSRQGGVRSVSLTGWTAVIGMAALVVLMMAGATIAVRQYIGHGDKVGYTLVTKQAPAS